jgi:hypothetical protein
MLELLNLQPIGEKNLRLCIVWEVGRVVGGVDEYIPAQHIAYFSQPRSGSFLFLRGNL